MNFRKIFKALGIIIIFIFLYSYFIEKSGYYEYNLKNKKFLTDEQIKRFEEDVKIGNVIDINSYLEDTAIDYSNHLTRRTSEVSLKLNDYLKNILTNTFKGLGVFVK